MKKLKLYILLFVSIFVLVGCSKPIEKNIDTVKGEIKSINDNSIEIEELDDNKSKFVVFTKDAKINSNIKDGDSIEVTYEGGIRESYPMQITATEINLINNAPIRKAIMIRGELYYNTEEEITFARCGVMDGKVESTVGEDQLPTQDNQSNFGKGYEYQYTSERSVDVIMDNKWIRFSKDVDIVEGLNMEVLEYSNEHIKLNIINNTENDLNYGESYAIEIFNGVTWNRLKHTDDVAFIEIAYSLDSGKTNLWETNIKFIYGKLENGKYRIVKTFFNGEHKYHIATEFEIK